MTDPAPSPPPAAPPDPRESFVRWAWELLAALGQRMRHFSWDPVTYPALPVPLINAIAARLYRHRAEVVRILTALQAGTYRPRKPRESKATGKETKATPPGSGEPAGERPRKPPGDGGGA